MKTKTELQDERRPYRQTARAAAAEATAQRIVDAFRVRLERLWFEDIRLEDVAQDAFLIALEKATGKVPHTGGKRFEPDWIDRVSAAGRQGRAGPLRQSHCAAKGEIG